MSYPVILLATGSLKGVHPKVTKLVPLPATVIFASLGKSAD